MRNEPQNIERKGGAAPSARGGTALRVYALAVHPLSPPKCARGWMAVSRKGAFRGKKKTSTSGEGGVLLRSPSLPSP